MKKNKTAAKARSKDNPRGRTAVPGQNPQADDSPEHDEHHDENRRNLYEEPVAEHLKGRKAPAHP